MTFRAKPVVKRDHRPSWESEGRRNLYLNLAFGAIVLLAILILLAAVGAGYYGDHFAAVATVNGQAISKDDLRDRVAVDGFRFDRQESFVQDQVSTGRLTQAQADSQRQSIASARQQMPQSSLDRLIDATLQAQLAAEESVTVTEQQVDERMVAEATRPEQRHIWAIAVQPEISPGATAPTDAQSSTARAKAGQALAELRAGKKWEDVAKTVSTDSSSTQGGDLGWTTKEGPYEAVFLDALFAATVDAPPDVIKGADGIFRIGRVSEIAAASTDPDYEQQISDSGVTLASYRKAVRADLLRTALSDKITTAATETATVQRRVSQIFLQGSPGATPVDEVKSSHILFSPNDDPSNASQVPADDPAWKKAEDEANAAYAELQKDPSKFAEMATALSDDTGSGADGGALPWFKEADVDPAYGTAIFAPGLQPGEILKPVKSSFGWHVIRFDERRPDAGLRMLELHDKATAPGADFAALAKANSDSADAAGGGSLGWVARDQLAKDLEDAIFATPVGSVSEITSTQAGYYLFKVEEEQTRKPDGDQLTVLERSAFSNWYAAKKAAATIEGGTVSSATP